MLLRTIAGLTLAATLTCAFPPRSHANPALREAGEVFRGTVGRYLLTETDRGLSILGRTTGIEIETAAVGMWTERTGNVPYAYRRFLVEMGRAQSAADAAGLAGRIRRAEERIRSFRAPNGPAGGAAEIRSLSAAERALLDSFAGSMMRLEDGFRFVREIEAGSGAGRSIGAAREAFLEGAEVGRSQRMWLEPPAPRAVEDPFAFFRERFGTGTTGREAAEWQARGWIGEMKACLRSMPTRARRLATARLIGQQALIAEISTITGYVIASGGRKVDWSRLPADMIAAGAAAALEPLFALHGGSLFMRYVEMAGFGAARGALEAGYYYFTPQEDAHGQDPLDVALAQGGYSTAWSAASTPLKLGLFTGLLGLECMYPTATMTLASTGIQLVHGIGSSYGYLYVRDAAPVTGRD